ncbi:MAG: hypothetical protein WD004_04230 [Actinomycetota bacterium]
MTTWTVLIEAPIRSGEVPGEAEVALLDALGRLGADSPITGGGAPDRLSARFCVDGSDIWEVVARARNLFSGAVQKASLAIVDAPDVLEVMPMDELIKENAGAREPARSP